MRIVIFPIFLPWWKTEPFYGLANQHLWSSSHRHYILTKSAQWWEKQLIFAGHTFSLSCWTCCFAVFDAARSDNSLARRNSIVIVITSSPDEGFLHNKTQTLHQSPGPSMLQKESILMIAGAGVIGELNNHLKLWATHNCTCIAKHEACWCIAKSLPETDLHVFYLSCPFGGLLSLISSISNCCFCNNLSIGCVWSSARTGSLLRSSMCCWCFATTSPSSSQLITAAAEYTPWSSSECVCFEVLDLEGSGFVSCCLSCSWLEDFHFNGVRGVNGVRFLDVIEGLPAAWPPSFSISPDSLDLLEKEQQQCDSRNKISFCSLDCMCGDCRQHFGDLWEALSARKLNGYRSFTSWNVALESFPASYLDLPSLHQAPYIF